MRFDWPVVLASGSPRRQELLKELAPEFEILPPDIDEDALTDPDPFVTAQRLAREKALAVREKRPDCLIIAGDTVVALSEGEGWVQLAKPQDEDHAAQMLARLAGNTHTVITGVCLVWPKGMSAFTDHSQVTFKPMTDAEIRDYIATGEPMDKAGSYGLQGGAKRFLDRIEGSVTNVIGLPMEKLKEALKSV